MKRAALLLVALALGGCATIQRHPVATAVVVGIVAGSIAASVEHDHRRGPQCEHPGCFHDTTTYGVH